MTLLPRRTRLRVRESLDCGVCWQVTRVLPPSGPAVGQLLHVLVSSEKARTGYKYCMNIFQRGRVSVK